MLRASLLRSKPVAPGGIGSRVGAQWLVAQRASQRYFADARDPNIAAPPLTTPANPSTSDTVPAQGAPARVAETIPPAATPPTGTGSASVAPDPETPKKKPRRFRRFLFYTLLLSALGYGGGVYYSLISDNFHDFFTEYVPFGEDAVGYFEEREFRKRFPRSIPQPRLHEQVRGENKVTISRKSGISPRDAVDENAKKSDLSGSGRHLSAVAENEPKPNIPVAKAADQPADSNTRELLPKDAIPAAAEKAVEAKDAVKEKVKEEFAPATTPLINNLEVPNAEEPVVQEVVKIVNDIITVINADQASGKYEPALNKAKQELGKVINDITALKQNAEKAAEDKIRATHVEFDNAAKELIRRLEAEMQEQETKWREEFENEREKLSQAYQNKVKSELQVAQQVYEQRLKNELLEQSIALQRKFAAEVRDRVEKERSGRLGRLNELSDKLEELEKLTSEWNKVVESNLKTQHLIVAVEAVRSTLEKADRPKPFAEELAALKEVADDNPVVNAAIASVNPTAYQRGIPTSAQLIDRFRRVASEVRKAALLPEDAGVASHLASLALSKVMLKKQGLPTGDDVESVLTRTEAHLEEGDLDAAAREMNGLNGWAKVLARDWLSEVRRVLEVRQALDVISTEARLQSLLVD